MRVRKEEAQSASCDLAGTSFPPSLHFKPRGRAHGRSSKLALHQEPKASENEEMTEFDGRCKLQRSEERGVTDDAGWRGVAREERGKRTEHVMSSLPSHAPLPGTPL